MPKRGTAHDRPHTLKSFGPISNICSHKNIKLACDTNGVHEGATMWLFHFFMNKNASAALYARLSADGTGM